jgi:phosphoglycolate phosphatase-like HAD superfamily hydrolase
MLDRQIARLALLRHGLGEPVIDTILPVVMRRMGERYRQLLPPGARRSWVLPGVRSVIERLRSRGHLTGVLTGNAETVARVKLAAAELAELLPFGAYGDCCDERHQLVEQARLTVRARFGLDLPRDKVVLVGDTPRDIAAARDSGTRILAVATGRFSVEELREHAPDAVLPDLADADQAVTILETIGACDRAARLADEPRR